MRGPKQARGFSPGALLCPAARQGSQWPVGRLGGAWGWARGWAPAPGAREAGLSLGAEVVPWTWTLHPGFGSGCCVASGPRTFHSSCSGGFSVRTGAALTPGPGRSPGLSTHAQLGSLCGKGLCQSGLASGCGWQVSWVPRTWSPAGSFWMSVCWPLPWPLWGRLCSRPPAASKQTASSPGRGRQGLAAPCVRLVGRPHDVGVVSDGLWLLPQDGGQDPLHLGRGHGEDGSAGSVPSPWVSAAPTLSRVTAAP